MRIKNRGLVFGCFVAALLAFSPVTQAPVFADLIRECPEHFLKPLKATYESTFRMVSKLEKFAKEHQLPMQILEVGPEERKVQRLFVALDVNQPELMTAYLKKFNFDDAIDDSGVRTLPLEFQVEVPGRYVTGVFRPSADPSAPIYRWGRMDLPRTEWWSDWFMLDRGTNMKPSKNPILGYAHLIGIRPDEAENVRRYLDLPDLRAPCKNDNCVAWTSGIELGRTAAGASPEERKFLFSELGMARSVAHFEIGRRLMNAANERHAAVIVFVNGQEGIDAFKANLAKHLPPAPQIPYENVIKGLRYAEDSDIMKAINVIPDGAKVFVPIAAGASPDGVAALVQKAITAQKGYDVHVLVNGVSENVMRKAADLEEGKIRLHALFLGGNLREAHSRGRVAYIPGYLGDFTRWVRDPDKPQFHYDAIIVRVAPADEQGRYSLGPNNDMILSIIHNRPGIKVIAEVNPNIPRTIGDNFLREEQITAKFVGTSQLAGPPVVPFTDVEARIGKHLASLVPDAATLQIGIGNIFGGIPSGFKAAGRKNIKIFTEMFSDQMKDLIQLGIAKKAQAGFAYGSQELYKWLNMNDSIRFVETEIVNNPGTIASKPKFHAINTALQVDLLGNVNATMGPEGRRISSPGGQVEFMSGAAKSEGGKAIIAIRSTAKNEEISTISLDLYPGPVTTPYESVTHVVTEYGIADLAGKSEPERIKAMIEIAHPKFRGQLIDEAVKRKMISADFAATIKRDA